MFSPIKHGLLQHGQSLVTNQFDHLKITPMMQQSRESKMSYNSN